MMQPLHGASPCWHCGAPHHVAHQMNGKARAPHDGDAVVCFSCGNIGVVRAGSMAEPTIDEILKIQRQRAWPDIEKMIALVKGFNASKISTPPPRP